MFSKFLEESYKNLYFSVNKKQTPPENLIIDNEVDDFLQLSIKLATPNSKKSSSQATKFDCQAFPQLQNLMNKHFEFKLKVDLENIEHVPNSSLLNINIHIIFI